MSKLNDAKAAIVDAIIKGLEATFSDEGKFEVYDLEVDGGVVDITLIPAGKTPDAAITFKVTVAKAR